MIPVYNQSAENSLRSLGCGDVSKVHLPWDSRFSPSSLLQHLEQHPDLAFWNAATGEYVVGGYWRARRDIGLVVESSKGRSQASLVERLACQLKKESFRALVLSQDEAESGSGLYLRRGWRTFDRLLAYRLSASRFGTDGDPELVFAPFQVQDLAALTQLDREAFPWLWWNEPSDFLSYASSPQVAAFLARQGDRLLGYVSYSTRNGRGHLDRLAARPSLWRKGLGSRMLAFSLRRMWQAGVREVGLTTQETNLAAQELYTRFGFVRTGEVHEVLGLELSGR